MTDFRDETIYFVMTTRFYDGDTSNNVQCWDAQNLNTDDPPWRGDFKGLIQKLDYIKALGFTAIWITPVVENASGYDYHGYHAVNFEKVDSRYESDDCTYQDLIDAVHAKGMKIIQDVVFNHTGNWGEENLYPMFTKDENADLSDVSCMIRNMDMEWASDYDTFLPENQRGTYQLRDRLKLMNADSDAGKKYDINDIYHHFGFVGSSFEQPIVQYGSIHYADCMDLNTENPQVYHYLVDAYSQYIRMGVDAFRIDTVKHLSRLTFNEAFNQQLNDVYNEVHGTTGEGNFYMFGEVCTRWRGTWNSNIPSISSPFYTWKETKEYAWDDSETAAATATNNASAMQHYQDNASNVEAQPTSNNVYLNGNEYHAPDYSQASGLNVIDFPMHWAFKTAGEAYQQALAEDPYYNDSSFNVTYVDSHDYAPDNAPENKRYEGSQAQWAENLNLMFTFRGIPCIYYGSEIEFQKGCVIDPGPQTALAETGRAYFGDLIEGSVDVVDFAKYTNATGAMADTLNHPLSLHIQRLNRLRAAIPALRKGQYSTNGCNGSFAYKRRYTDATTDSFALIALSSDATFNNIPNGTYTDAITGDVKTVANGTLSTSGIKGQGDLRVYVLDTALTKAPGMIEGFSDYMSGGKDVVIEVKEPTGISLDKTSADLDLGGTERFTATVLPSDATNKTVSWSSSNPSVATVSSNGLVTAKGEGTATIYAATSNAAAADYDKQSGLVATATITVKASGILVTSVTLNPSSVTLETGDTAQINAAIAPANASPQYTALSWSSSDTAVARVNNEGLVTAVKPGTATITAITVSGVSAKVDVEVTGKTVIIYGNAIYFEKPSGWGGNINAYFWSEDGSGWKNAGWPGTAMILTDEENGIYGMEWPEGKENAAIKVIFNDGGNQTADLDAVINGYFNQNGYVKTVPVNEKPSDANIQVAFADSSTVYTYDGTQQKPEVIVTNNGIKLSEGKDYVVNYKNNVNACDKTAGASAPTVTVTGKGTYADAVIERNSLTFTIQQKSLDADGVTVAVKTQEAVYTGERIEPEVTVTDTKGVITADDYEVTYSNNIRVGTAKVTVAGRGNYTGTVEKSFKIVKQNLPPNAPQTKMSVSVELGKLSAVALPENWRWSQVDENKSIQLGENFTATAVYIGNDQDNYEKLTVQVTIIGINCEHKEESKREIRNKIAPTCTEAGYSGDTYCTVCQTKLSDGEILEAVGHKWNGKPAIDKAATCTEAGSRSIHCSVCDAVKAGSTEAVPALGHTGGTATCSQLALCNRCHKKYGGLDADNHVHTCLLYTSPSPRD